MDPVKVVEIRKTRKLGPVRAFADSESHLYAQDAGGCYGGPMWKD